MKSTDVSQRSFKAILQAHKQTIDNDINQYIQYLQESTREQYSEASQQALKAYCDVLGKGGKRLRGALVLEGYQMCGGTDQAMIIQAARALEMIHASMLVIDDVQDRSQTRRGGPTAQVQLKKIYKDEHLAETLAVNSALLGVHAAMMILANLDAPAQLRTNVLSILNRTLVITIHGQIADPINQLRDDLTEADVTKMQEWKTATYTILNPLHVGMVLAGAGCEVTDGITPYAHGVGQAFQITDDIIGTFGEQQDTGKDPEDDIREGKRTLLIVHALKHAPQTDMKFLQKCLGNQKLSTTDFNRCREIIRQAGSVEYAQNKAKNYVDAAVQSLQQHSSLWSAEGTAFLDDLANYLLSRIS